MPIIKQNYQNIRFCIKKLCTEDFYKPSYEKL